MSNPATPAPRRCAKCTAGTLLQRVQVPHEERRAVDIDACPRCRGVWLDWGEVGELKDLVGLIPSFAGNAAWQRDLEHGHCPACTEQTALAHLPVGAYAVDRCPECLGLWFDGGELGPLLSDRGFASLLKALRSHPA